MKEMQDNGMSISAIAREMHIDRKTVIKYISRIKEQEEKGKKTIKQIEIEERTKTIGMKEAEHTTEKYLEFRDEIDEYMTKLLQLRWKYDAYITGHKVTFVDLVETALKEYVENTKNKMNVREFLGNLIMVKALEKMKIPPLLANSVKEESLIELPSETKQRRGANIGPFVGHFIPNQSG